MGEKVVAEIEFVPVAGVSYVEVEGLTFKAFGGIAFHKHHMRRRIPWLGGIDVTLCFDGRDEADEVGFQLYFQQYVDRRFGCQSRYGCASDMADADDIFRSYGFHEAVFFCFVTLGPVAVVRREDDREQLPEFFVTHFVQILIFHGGRVGKVIPVRPYPGRKDGRRGRAVYGKF